LEKISSANKTFFISEFLVATAMLRASKFGQRGKSTTTFEETGKLSGSPALNRH
jgi:hypothetical protein